MMMVGMGRLMRPVVHYQTAASNYDGTNDFARRGGDLTGIADGKEGTIAWFMDLQGGDGADQYVFEIANRVQVFRDSSNRIDVILRNSGGTIIGRRRTSDTYVASGGYIGVQISWDLANADFDFYVNDAVPTLGVTTPTTNDTVDYTATEVSVGERATVTGSKLNACLSELFFHTSYLDLSNEANRRRFISADLRPQNIGPTGTGALGVQPLLYAPDGDPSDNKGTGGDFTITGALAVCNDTP